MANILLRHRDVPDIHKLDVYLNNGGYEGLKKAVRDYKPDEVIDLVKKAVVRGRGGAGFPAGPCACTFLSAGSARLPTRKSSTRSRASRPRPSKRPRGNRSAAAGGSVEQTPRPGRYGNARTRSLDVRIASQRAERATRILRFRAKNRGARRLPNLKGEP